MRVSLLQHILYNR